MSEPDISVIVVNYNAGPMLAACLAATRRNRAVMQRIVVDNASSDDSITQMENLDDGIRPLLIRNDRNKGFSRAVNTALQRARGRAVLILNPDCIVFPGAVDRLLRTLDDEPAAGIVGGLVVNIDGSEQRGCRRNEPTPKRIARRMLLGERGGNGIDRTGEPLPDAAVPVDAVSGAFLLADRALMLALDGMDAGYFLHFEDLDLCRRVRDRGRAVMFEPGALAVHLKSASGGTDSRVVARHKRDGLLRYLDTFHRGAESRVFMTFVRLAAGAHLYLGDLRRGSEAREASASGEDPRAVLAALDDWLAAPLDDRIVVTGGTSQVGEHLLPAASRRYAVLATTRGGRAGRFENGAWWVRPGFPAILAHSGASGIKAWLHVAPIWLLEQFFPAVAGLAPARLVAVSSTSIETKRDSGSSHDREIVAKLERGEGLARELGERCGAAVTVFRPSMIYGAGKDSNVTFIGRWMRRLRVFPIVGEGRGKRQPVHAADVAKSCLDVLDRPETFGRIYNLAGSEVIEFKEMIERVFASKSIAPAYLPVPARLLKAMLAVAGRLPGLGFLTPAMVDRVNHDLVFDITPAREDFGYSPRGFEP